MREPRYTRRVELTFKSHMPLSEQQVEDFLTGAASGLTKRIQIGSPLRDVSVAIDDVSAPEAI